MDEIQTVLLTPLPHVKTGADAIDLNFGCPSKQVTSAAAEVPSCASQSLHQASFEPFADQDSIERKDEAWLG